MGKCPFCIDDLNGVESSKFDLTCHGCAMRLVKSARTQGKAAQLEIMAMIEKYNIGRGRLTVESIKFDFEMASRVLPDEFNKPTNLPDLTPKG